MVRGVLLFAPERVSAPTVNTMKPPAVAFDCKASGRSGFGVGDIASTSRAMGHSGSHQNGGGQQAVAFGSAVRRLTPVECEALQGFYRNYTAITYRGKLAADGNRYKALGNAMAVPCIRWILTRLELVDQLVKAPHAI